MKQTRSLRSGGTYLGCCLVSAVSFLAAPTATAAEQADKRPSILFALADDWSWPHAGVYGDKVVKTPTFDRVAAEGMLFSHTFSVTPSCTASRAAIQRRK